jgi:hypothetical protein
MNPISTIRARLGRVPFLLRSIAMASFGIGIAFPLVAVIPGATFDFFGDSLSWRELWQTRVAFALLATGPLMLFVAFAIFRRARWVRPVLVVLPILQSLPFRLVHWAFSAPNPIPSLQAYIFSSATWALVATIYLFGFNSVRAYFASGKTTD